MKNNYNESIKCVVDSCKHHCPSAQYCNLGSITVGTHEASPTKIECTDCQNFEK